MIKLFTYCCVFVGLLLVQPLYSQGNKITQLEKKLAKAKGKAKVDILNELAEAYKDEDKPKLVMTYAKKADKLAQSLNYKAGLAESYHQQGAALALSKKFAESITMFKRSLKLFQELKLDKKTATVLNKLGGAHFYSQQVDKAVEYTKQALNMYKQLKDYETAAQLYGHLGIVHAQQNKLDASLEYYKKSETWYQENKRWQDLANILVNMSEVYFSKKDLPNTINSLLRSYNLFTKLKLNPQRVTLAERIGYAYSLGQKHDSSAYYYKTALDIRPKTADHAKARASVHKRLAGAYFYQNMYDQSLDYSLRLIKYLDANSDNKEIAEQLMVELVNVGVLCDKLGKYDESIQHYQRSLKLRKKYNKTEGDAALWVNIGVAHLNQKNYDDGFKAFSRSLKMREAAKDTANMLGVYGHLANMYNEMKDYGRMARIMEKLLELRQQSSKYKLGESDKIELLKKISGAYYEAKKFEKVYFYQSKLLKIHEAQNDLPSQAQGLLNLGVCAEELKRNSEAVDYYEKAAQLFKKTNEKEDESKAYYNVATVYQKLKNKPKALEMFKKSLVIREELEQKKAIMVIANEIANIYIQQDKYKEAIVYLKKADEYIEKPENEIKVLERLTLCYFSVKNYAKALEHAQELVKIKPKDASFRNSEALMYIKMGKYPEALNALNKAIELSDDLTYLYNRGRVYMRLDQPQKAIEDYNVCVSKVTNSPDLYCSRAYAYLKAGITKKADTDLAKASEIAPALPAIQVVQAAYFMTKKQPKKAIERLQKAVKQGLKDKRELTDEKLFAPLRDKAAFKALVNKLED
jgi:tetratricopeptide (TPR) repeat protein